MLFRSKLTVIKKFDNTYKMSDEQVQSLMKLTLLSPSHFAIRMPFREATVLTRNLKSLRTSTDALSPHRSVKVVNPERSTNANVRSNLSSYGFSSIIFPQCLKLETTLIEGAVLRFLWINPLDPVTLHRRRPL